MYRRIFTQSITAALVGGIAFAVSGCASKTTREGRSPAYLIVNSLQGASGADPEKLGSPLASDVITNVKDPNDQSRIVATVFSDVAEADMALALRDIGQPGSPTEPTTNNAITLNRYHVEYRRSDGRNTPGVDVPYAFDGAITATISGVSSTKFGFEVVRIQAKEEAPLRAMRGNGGAQVISTLADVTFYGRDQVGNEVIATATLQINFADWGDPSN
jgi:hypothetical protein